MRVVAGKWRGRKLNAPRGDTTRPTTDRVKEALFSILGDAVADARVVDLCCGSGGLGIEALSRGAAEVVFVDDSWQALEAVKRNLASCDADADTYSLVRRDALSWLDSPTDQTDRIDIVLSDPPYAGTLPADVWRACCERAAGARIERAVLEHDPDLELSAPPPGWHVDRRRYGATALSIMEKTND